MNKETWKKITNYEAYEISNFGRIRKKGKILKLYENDKGYLYASLSQKGKRKQFRVHRLVALAFIYNPNNLPEVNHIDENKRNNRADNLEWCTRKYNINYGDGMKKASKSHCKKINQYDLLGNHIKTWNSITEATTELNGFHIRDVLKGRRKKALNCYWKYEDE